MDADLFLIQRGCCQDVLTVDYGLPTNIYEIQRGKPMIPAMVKHDSGGWKVVDAGELKRLCNGLTAKQFLDEELCIRH